MNAWPSPAVAELQAQGVLLVEDGNHGEYRPRPDEFVEGGTAFIRAADIADGRVLFAEAGTINDIALARIRKGVGRAGDIIFSHKGTIGKLARVQDDAPPFVCSPQTTFWRVLDESRLSRQYLYAFMRSQAFINQWWVRKGETDMADYVSLTAQRQLRVVIPPLEIQERIARPLTALDDLIDNCRRRIAVLEQMAQAVYREWFVRFRFPGHENVVLVDSPLGPTPEGWAISPIKDLVAVVRDSVHAQDVPENHPAVGLEHIPRQQLTLDHWGRAGELQSRKTRFCSGDVLFGKIRPYFHKVSVAPIDGICSTDAIVVRPKPHNWGLVVLTLFSDEFVAHAAQTATGTKMPRAIGRSSASISLRRHLKACPHGSPTWWSHLDLAEDLMFTAHGLAAMRNLILPKLVTGQLDVSELYLDTVVGSVA